jgi:hypothetical protein
MWQRVRLDNTWQYEHDKICPHCHLPLPLSVAGGELGGEAIAVLGEQASGKSTYFGVLIHQLRNSPAGSDIGLSVVPQDSFDPENLCRVSSQRLYDRVYGSMFGETPTMPAPTRGAAESSPTPLIYRLQFGSQRWWTQLLRQRKRALEVVFFDLKGGDLVVDSVLELYYRYLSQVRGIMLLIDPINLPGVRDRLPVEVQPALPPVRNSEATVVVESIIKLFERFGNLGSRDSIEIPIAITLAKTDLTRSIAPAMFFRPARHVEGFDREGVEEVSKTVQKWLEEQGQHYLVQLLTRFSRRTYCAVSALGTAAELDKRILLTRNPSRVVDPLFAVLFHLGYLRARQIP